MNTKLRESGPSQPIPGPKREVAKPYIQTDRKNVPHGVSSTTRFLVCAARLQPSSNAFNTSGSFMMNSFLHLSAALTVQRISLRKDRFIQSFRGHNCCPRNVLGFQGHGTLVLLHMCSSTVLPKLHLFKLVHLNGHDMYFGVHVQVRRMTRPTNPRQARN